jgi:L-ribulose-5-phosphate 3-epimerase UlaE
VRKAIQLRKNIDFDKIHLSIDNKKDRKNRRKERDKLIYQIVNNLKIPWWKKFVLKRIIASR